MPGRLLRLLTLLQSRRAWSGRELAERLDVTERTLRRDVQRLRELDYPVTGITATAGGYLLRAGRNLPPLMLDHDEAIVIAVSLTATVSSTTGAMSDAVLSALAKLAQVMPSRLRQTWNAVADTAAAVPRTDLPNIDPTVLAELAACRDREMLRFSYQRRDGTSSERRVEPHHLVVFSGHWYLLAFDTDRDDWRTFRVDRLRRTLPTGRHFTARELPGESAAEFVADSFAHAEYTHTARVTVELPADTVRDQWHGPRPGSIEPLGPDRCLVTLSAEDPVLVVQHTAAVAALGAAISIDASAEVEQRLRQLGGILREP